MKTTLLSTIALFLTFCHSHFAQECIDIPNLPTNQINANINDDTNYPVGSAFYSEGNIEFIKTPNTSPWNHQPGDTTICTSGANLMISVANASAPKTLTIDMDSEYGMVVDGDTIYDNSNPPANYSGNNFNFTHVANPISEYTVDGDFDTVEVLANNLCIYNMCLDANDSVTENCIDIPNLPTNQINANISDDRNYPVGSTFYSEGNIEFIKTPNTSPWNHQPGDTTICTSGANFMISVANASAPKTLTIDMDSEYGMVVDGDTIYDNSNPPANYSGNNFNFTHVANPISEYTIDGDFDTVEVLANNLCIYGICLEENALNLKQSVLTNANQLTIYPNPAERSEAVNIDYDTDIEQLVVRSLNGQLMFQSNPSSQNASFMVNERFESGLYIVSLYIDNRWEHRKLMIK